jgi:hypothetical protein
MKGCRRARRVRGVWEMPRRAERKVVGFGGIVGSSDIGEDCLLKKKIALEDDGDFEMKAV